MQLSKRIRQLYTYFVKNSVSGTTSKWRRSCHPRVTAYSSNLCNGKIGQINLWTGPKVTPFSEQLLVMATRQKIKDIPRISTYTYLRYRSSFLGLLAPIETPSFYSCNYALSLSHKYPLLLPPNRVTIGFLPELLLPE